MPTIDVTQTHEVIDALFANEVVGIPTDTVYGLAAMPNRTAIKRMIDLKKGRDKDQPIAILFSELEKLEQYGVDFKKIQSLGEFWPGALTVVTSASTNLLPIPVVTEEGTVGVRIPDNEIAIQIIEKCGGVLAVSSANHHGDKPALNASEVAQQFGDELLVLDGGVSPGGTASTVVDMTSEIPTVLREGEISIEEIKRCLGKD